MLTQVSTLFILNHLNFVFLPVVDSIHLKPNVNRRTSRILVAKISSTRALMSEHFGMADSDEKSIRVDHAEINKSLKFQYARNKASLGNGNAKLGDNHHHHMEGHNHFGKDHKLQKEC